MRSKRHIWITAVLAVYFIGMAVYFGRDLIAAGKYTRFAVTVVAEIACLTGVFFALRAKSRMAEKRK